MAAVDPLSNKRGQPTEPRDPSSTTDGLGLDLDLDTTTRMPWPERLRELSQLASTSPGTVYIEADTEETIHAHLDAVEAILRDPRPELTREITRHRQQNSGPKADVEVAEKATMTEEDTEEPTLDQDAVLAQLTALLREVTLLNGEVERRRGEAREIRDLFEERCRGFMRTVAELEDEVLEL